jgi:hypothetical protein
MDGGHRTGPHCHWGVNMGVEYGLSEMVMVSCAEKGYPDELLRW